MTKRTILVVEDQPHVRRLLVRILEGEGFRLLVAATANEALAVVASHEGDLHLILTDVSLPDLSGPDLVRHLHEDHPAVPALLMSGHSESTLVGQGLMQPGMPLLCKPFNVVDAVELIRASMNETTDPAPSVTSGDAAAPA